MSRRPPLYLVLSAVLIAGLAVVLANGRWRRGSFQEPDRWPSPRAALSAEQPRFPDGFGVHRIYVDAGHGAEGNRGNLSSFCQHEEDFTLRVATHLARALQSTGRFEARLSRSEAPVAYADRVREAHEWHAEVFLSIHSDVRGVAERWSPRSGTESCPRSDTGPGFAVLYSDDPESGQVEPRAALANHLALRLQRAGFPAYDGAEYAGTYVSAGAGVFIDRHASDKRIYVLKKTAMPAVLIETHNAIHPQEALRWSEEQTLTAFDAAVTCALTTALASSALASRP